MSCDPPSFCQNGNFNNETGICICEYGFTSFADLRFGPKVETCDVSFIAIQVMYSLICFLNLTQALKLIIDFFKVAQRRGWNYATNLKLYFNQLKLSIFLTLVFGMIFSSLKISSPLFVLGTNETVTWIYMFWRSCSFVSGLGITGFLYSIELKAMGTMGKRYINISKLYWLNNFFAVLGFAGWSLIITTYYVQEHGCDLARAAYYLLAFNIFCNTFRKHYEMKPLLRSLKEAAIKATDAQSKDDMTKTHQKFVGFYHRLVHQQIIFATILVIVFSVQITLQNVTYYIATSAFVLSLGDIPTITALTTHRDTRASSKQTSRFDAGTAIVQSTMKAEIPSSRVE